MRRLIEADLVEWMRADHRKPLLVRGARQVGKTHSLEKLGRDHFEHALVVDFEKHARAHQVFSGDLDARGLIQQLEVVMDCRIEAGKTLLLLDEIQACPRAITALRYFYEDYPELHVVAAGSLLEFALGGISFPVGRVQLLEMHPMTLVEFLWALERERAAEIALSPPESMPEAMHRELLAAVREYCFVGGMPECVALYAEHRSLKRCFDLQDTLIATIRADFPKYAGRSDPGCLDAVLESIPRRVGQQIKYTRLAEAYSGPTIKKAFDLLQRARIVHKVRASSASGLPLGFGVSSRRFKALFLDVGLWQRLSGLRSHELAAGDLLEIYQGALAEQYVGQEMRVSQGADLHYWTRESRGSQAEVDYLAVIDGRIHGVEVKSGSAGRLRSLHCLLEENPGVAGGLVLSSRPYERLPEQKLTFLPLYRAFSATSDS
ncbi:MAG: ATP-binding protein [Deltaproteobacteria bacterium]|nr:ATP-binding protein [Deltaproteobacteria bacterium]